MKTANTIVALETKSELDIVDLTGKVKGFIQESKIKDGLVNIQTMHTTAAVFVNEKEPELLKDFKNHLEKLAPKDNKYHHDNFDVRTVNMCENECANGRSHCRAINLPVNVCLNLISGKLQLGTWQKILFVELDRPRKRQVQIQVIGE